MNEQRPPSKVSTSAQIVRDPETGKPAFAVIPYARYLALVQSEEDRADSSAMNAAVAAMAAGEEAVSIDLWDRLRAGEQPVLVWREYRGMTQGQVATAARVAKPIVAAIESGVRPAARATLTRIAAVLKVDPHDLAPRKERR